MLETIDVEAGDGTNRQDLTIFVPADLKKVHLNGLQTFQEKPAVLAGLNAGDRLKVWYDYQGASGNVASRLEVLRGVELQGILAEDCNGASERQQRKPAIGQTALRIAIRYHVNGKGSEAVDLKRGDRVTVKHDNYIAEVVAQRTVGRRRGRAADRLRARRRSTWRRRRAKDDLLVGPECKITLGDEAVPLDVLRGGDRVKIEHGAIDAKSQSAISATAIAAERPTDATRWALIVAVQNYDDKRLSPLSYPLADAALWRRH